MSVFHPLPESPPAEPRRGEPSSRERALLKEIAALRAENARLRQGAGDTPPPGHGAPPGLAGEAPPVPGAPPVTLPADDPHTPAAREHHGSSYDEVLDAVTTVYPIGMFRTDASGRATHVDERLKQIVGAAAEALPDGSWLPHIHPDDLDRVQRDWVARLPEGEGLTIECRLIRADQRVIHVLLRNLPQRSADGQLVSQLGFVQDITQLRELEADARLKEDLNRQIIASSPDCTKVLDLQGRVLQMTAQGCRLVEIDDFETVRNSDWCTWWPENSGAQARAALTDAARGQTARFLAQAPTFKGTPKWWDTVISPICGPNGQAAMLLAVSRDITDLHWQQEEIRLLNVELESRVQLRTQELASANQRLQTTLQEAQALYDHAPCGYHSVDATGRYVLMNQTALNWLGYSHDEVVNRMSFREVLLPAYLPEVEARLARLLANEPLDATEVGMRRRDGTEFLALISSTAVFDEQGRFVRSNSTLVNITERKAAELALATQQAFLQTITNSVPVQLAFYDRDLICRFANASYARWINSSPDQLVGRHLGQVARPEDFARAQPYLVHALAGEAQRFEGQRTFPDGQSFYASIEYTPYVQHGEVRGIVIQMLDITQRKASEDQVQQVNAQLNVALAQAQQLYDEAPCGYHSLDINGFFVSINDTELEWLGYQRDEVVGKRHFADFILPSRRPLLEDRLQRLVDHGVLEGSEYEMRRRDGSIFHALLSSSAVRDADGRFLRSNTTVVNINQRKLAEMALQDNQRFLRGVTDHVPGLLAYLDVMLRYRFANLEHLHIYGMDPARMIGLHASECMPVDNWPDIAPRLELALKGEAQNHEAWRKTAQGVPIFVRESYLPDLHEDRVQGVFVQIIDITERKRVEERVHQLNDELECRIRERSAELLESEQRFRLMVDNLREYCIFFLDAEGRITDWTDSAQRLEGYSPTEMMGRHYAVLFGPEGSVQGMAQANQILRLAASRGQHELNNWHTRKDGSRYWSHSLLIALRDDSGELRGFAKINRDMTDAKRLDDLMRNINDELENRVAERTEQLLAANKDLESFSYSVSHDLRSPLRHISSFVSLLEEHMGSQCDDVSARYLSTIGNSARHMSQLIDGLLAFSRLGRAAVNLTPVDFGLLVGTVVAQIAHDTEGRVVDWVVAPDLPVVQGDALLLREVWANLLGNAYKYTRPRERTRIEVGWSVDPAVGYTFFVRDNGVGFDTKYSTKLFGVFQRLHRASEFEGTGIGLALTRRIVERHGGSTWAESQLGEGSVFYFSLPFDGLHSTDSSRDSLYAALEP